MPSIPSLNDIQNFLGNRYDDVKNDFHRAGSATKEAALTGDADNLTMTRRDLVKGIGAGTAVYMGGSNHVVGDAYDAMVDAIPDSPVDVDVDITIGSGGSGGNRTRTSTETPTATEQPTSTPNDTDTPTSTPETTETPTSTPTSTQTPSGLTYDSILQGLSAQSTDTANAFQDYTLTALDNALSDEDETLEEVVNNSGEYSSLIGDLLDEGSGTYANGDDFNVAGYAEVGIQSDLSASSTFKNYLNAADDQEVLDQEVQNYIESMEIS